MDNVVSEDVLQPVLSQCLAPSSSAIDQPWWTWAITGLFRSVVSIESHGIDDSVMLRNLKSCTSIDMIEKHPKLSPWSWLLVKLVQTYHDIPGLAHSLALPRWCLTGKDRYKELVNFLFDALPSPPADVDQMRGYMINAIETQLAMRKSISNLISALLALHKDLTGAAKDLQKTRSAVEKAWSKVPALFQQRLESVLANPDATVVAAPTGIVLDAPAPPPSQPEPELSSPASNRKSTKTSPNKTSKDSPQKGKPKVGPDVVGHLLIRAYSLKLRRSSVR